MGGYNPLHREKGAWQQHTWEEVVTFQLRNLSGKKGKREQEWRCESEAKVLIRRRKASDKQQQPFRLGQESALRLQLSLHSFWLWHSCPNQLGWPGTNSHHGWVLLITELVLPCPSGSQSHFWWPRLCLGRKLQVSVLLEPRDGLRWTELTRNNLFHFSFFSNSYKMSSKSSIFKIWRWAASVCVVIESSTTLFKQSPSWRYSLCWVGVPPAVQKLWELL